MSTSTQQTPEWMDEDFQITCIEKSNSFAREDIVLKSLKVGYKVPLGVNFMSIIYDLKIEYELRGGSLREDAFVAKIKLDVKGFAEMETEGEMFVREVHMYETMLPIFQKILSDVGITDRLSCRYILTREPPLTLLMENLSANGYVMPNKIKCLDFEHCKMAFERLAILHASSMRWFSINGPPKEEFYYLPLVHGGKIQRDIFENYSKMSVNLPRNILASLPGYENVVQYFDHFLNEGIDRIALAFKCIPGNKFNAHLHGDAWLSNTMYKYDENQKVVDMTMVDFQISNYASVVNDFFYFFFTSANNDVIKYNFTTLAECYYNRLAATLKLLQYTEGIPTMEEFHSELHRARDITVFIVFFMQSFLKQNYKDSGKSSSGGLSVDDVTKKSQNVFDIPSVKSTFLLSIDLLLSLGYFEN